MDAILEVEKLNATQQLMAMIIPPSTVNVMLNKKIVVSSVKNQDILHGIALTVGAMSVTNMSHCHGLSTKDMSILQELQQHTINHTRVTMSDQVEAPP